MALERIVADKRVDVARRLRERPLASFRSALVPSERSLAAALARPHTGFILECKKASPSAGVLRADFDPVAIATRYAPFADAISVLTDEPYFQGRLEYLSAVRRAVELPVLCKDFVVDPYQVDEARLYGADAILLMASVLDDDGLSRCLDACRRLAMDALVEVHDAHELERALAVGATIIGVNNRDLKTLAIDLATSEALCPHVPDDVICVVESGITARAHVRRLRPLGDAFLVGGHLMGAPDLDRAIRELVFGPVKICGLTRVEHAEEALARGAVYGGLLLWPGSPRHVSLETAETLVRAVPLAWVGVFVNEDAARVGEAAHRLHLAAVQLHGDEGRESVAAVREAVPPGCAVWKAERVGPGRPIRGAGAWGADRVVLDRYAADARGGTGRRFDWDELANHPERHDMILGGGITPDNAAEADALGPFALDLSSGVERAPGDKDPGKLEALFTALRGQGRGAGARHPERERERET